MSSTRIILRGGVLILIDNSKMFKKMTLFNIYLLTGYEGIASLLSPRLIIDRGEAKVNSQGHSKFS
jgi:hypothetical protein